MPTNFTSVHSSITTGGVAKSHTLTGTFSNVQIVARSGLGDLFYSFDGTAAVNAGTSSVLCAVTGSYRDFEEYALGAGTETVNVSVVSAVTNTSYSIIGFY